MIIGNLFLAEEIMAPSSNNIIINGPNNIFPVLSTPAYTSFGVLFVMSGIDYSEPHDLDIRIYEKDNKDDKVSILKQRIEKGQPGIDPQATLNGNFNLRNIVINNLGYHVVELYLDNQPITEITINIIKTKPNR